MGIISIMTSRNLKETLVYLALTPFFGGGMLLTNDFIAVRSVWDAVVAELLILMNGLGLTVVLILWIIHLRSRHDEMESVPEKCSRQLSGKCG